MKIKSMTSMLIFNYFQKSLTEIKHCNPYTFLTTLRDRINDKTVSGTFLFKEVSTVVLRVEQKFYSF